MEGEQKTQEAGEKRKEAPEAAASGEAPVAKKAKEDEPAAATATAAAAAAAATATPAAGAAAAAGTVAAAADGTNAAAEEAKEKPEEGKGVFVIEGATIRLPMEHKRQKSMNIKQQQQQAYRQRLVQCIRANDMVTAFRVYEQMKELALTFDTKVFNMMLALCGGAMGERANNRKKQQQSQPAGDEGVDGHYGPAGGGSGSGGGGGGGGNNGRGGGGNNGRGAGKRGRGGKNRNGNHVAYPEANGNGAGEGGREDGGGSDAEDGAPKPLHRGSADANPSFAVECAFKIVADMEVALLKGQLLVEACFTALIRACCRDGQVERALGVLADMEKRGIAPRLRSFSPLLAACAAKGALQTCLECRDKAVAAKVELGDKEHACMVRACTAAGDAASFQAVVADYMEDVLQPQSREGWEALAGFFRSPAAAALAAGGGLAGSGGGGSGGGSSAAAAGLEEGDAPPAATAAATADAVAKAAAAAGAAAAGAAAAAAAAAALDTTAAAVEGAAEPAAAAAAAADGGGGAWEISEGMISDMGECSCCGETLKSVELSDKDTERLLLQVETLACASDIQKEQWQAFKAWLERKGKGAYDYVLDGANVGYYKMHHPKGQDIHQTWADLQQIDRVMAQLRQLGKKVAVILHSRHLNDRKLAPASLQVLRRWREADCVYGCQPRNNDDWYWLYAAAWMGGRTLALTNDEMRDHHFSMLSHRSFNRWKERHQVRFHFAEEAGGTLRQHGPRTLVTAEPTLYSKRMQRSDSGNCWHFPLEGSDAWLCISRQNSSRGSGGGGGSGSGGCGEAAVMDVEPEAAGAAAAAAAAPDAYVRMAAIGSGAVAAAANA